MTNKKKRKSTRDAVETSIDLAKTEKKGTWEDITEKKNKKTPRWEDITRADFLEVLKKISQVTGKVKSSEKEKT
jgi:hypothetical protein